MTMELMEMVEGIDDWSVLGDRRKPANYERKLKEAVDLLSNARGLAPHRAKFLLQEAIVTTDFAVYFGDVLERKLVSAYKAIDPLWKPYFKARPTVPDFRKAFDFATYGGDNVLPEVDEKGEYRATQKRQVNYEIEVKKRGQQFDISWETLVNDDLNALKGTPDDYARAAANTEHSLAINEYAGDIGAHVEGVGGFLYQNLINSVAGPLTIATLETALEMMAALTSLSGMPIKNMMKFLVVPPALEMTARQILTSTQKMWTDDAGGVFRASPTANVVSQMGLTLIVEPWLQSINAGGNGLTGWYLFADPSDIATLGYAHLEGHTSPEICMKASDKVAIGGGPISPFDGDFATDNVFYRVRHIFGVASLDWRGTFHGF